MLRINLLPPYIYDAAKRRTALILASLLPLLVLGAFAFWYSHEAGKLAVAENRKTEAENQKRQYDNYETQIRNTNDQIAQIRQKETFVADAREFNESWPDVYRKVRDVTSSSILLNQMSLDGQRRTVNLAGFTTSETNLIRWWMYLRSRCSDIVDASGRKLPALFESVRISLPPHPYQPEGGRGVAGAGGFGRGGFGYGGGIPGMPGMGGGPAGMMGPAGMGPMGPMASGMPGMGGRGGVAGLGGRFGGGGLGQASGGATETEIEGRKGLTFTAFAVLKEPTAGGKPVPSWPPAGGGRAGGAMGGAMGGMMGGMMGGPMGMMGGPMGPAGMGPMGPAGMGPMGPGSAPGPAGGASTSGGTTAPSATSGGASNTSSSPGAGNRGRVPEEEE
jgi:hypothetical protein